MLIEGGASPPDVGYNDYLLVSEDPIEFFNWMPIRVCI